MRHRKGFSLIYCTVVMVVFCGLCSLGVDLGRVQLAKTELQQASDAAARYGASEIPSNTAVGRAIASALENKVDGSPVVISASDVILGNWDEKAAPAFSSTRTPVNAVQVSPSRTAAKNRAIPLIFGSLVGVSSCDVHAVSIAKIAPGVPMGFIGLNGIDVKNNLLSASYDASVSKNPSITSHGNSGMLGSNTSITAGHNEDAGVVVLGPGATTNLTLTDPPIVLTTPIPVPVLDFSGAPATNPAGTSKNLTVNGSLTLPAGSYYFTSITIKNNAALSFSGPAKLYIDGNVTFTQNGSITAYNGEPQNLYIQQRGAGTIFGGSTANNVSVTAAIDAPQTAFIAWNGSALMGRGTFLTISVKNDAEFYYDESLRTSLPGSQPIITLVK